MVLGRSGSFKYSECKREKGQFVIPAFYGVVDPSHVRKQEGSYATAFCNTRNTFQQHSKQWY